MSNFSCASCGAVYECWIVFCKACNQWGSLESINQVSVGRARITSNSLNTSGEVGYGGGETQLVRLDEVELVHVERIELGCRHINKILGEGLRPGQVVLLAGEPGAGKSTLMLQTLAELGDRVKAIYVSAEETAQQIKQRAERLQLPLNRIDLLIDDDVDRILDCIGSFRARLVVVDSLKVMSSGSQDAHRGTQKQQVKCLERICAFAKQNSVAMIVICQFTKSGSYSGPREVEHMADTLLTLTKTDSPGVVEMKPVKNREASIDISLTYQFTGERGVMVPNE